MTKEQEQMLIDNNIVVSRAEARRIISQKGYELALRKAKHRTMKPYCDKYFLRSKEILVAENLNPWVNMQIFIRKGPGKVDGLFEAHQMLTDCHAYRTPGCRLYMKNDGNIYEAGETVMNIIAPIQSIIEWETIYLGIISYRTSLANGHDLNAYAFEQNIKSVVNMVRPRSVFYFGARHWHWKLDNFLSDLALSSGCVDCSTDNGAKNAGKEGVGTIPHALENIYAYYYGVENAVVKSTLAFHKYMSKEIPRIALIDYANKELADSLTLLHEMNDTLDGVRIDTCGENYMEGVLDGFPNQHHSDNWYSSGVSVEGVNIVVSHLREIKPECKIVLSSGFGKPEKVQQFIEAEKYLGIKLFDGIGAGFMDDIITATADIIAVGKDANSVDYNGGSVPMENIIHKVGRPPKVNNTLRRII